MRTPYERMEAICWVLRRGLVGDTGDNEEIMFSARFIAKLTGLPLWMVFYYARRLIRAGLIEGKLTARGEHVYAIGKAERAERIRLRQLEFMECDTCRAKRGSPFLCPGCLNNRLAIELLKGQ